MLEFIQIPIRDFFDNERAYFDYNESRGYIVLDHSTGTCVVGKPFSGIRIRGTFVEEHGLVYIIVPEPIFYK